MPITSSRRLLVPSLGTGLLMAAYLTTRPYGDTGSQVDAARAFASTWWVFAHVCATLALACFAWVTLRLSEVEDSTPTRLARRTSLVGTVLVLPYYGAETFGLHAVGRRALDSDAAAFTLVAEIREQPVVLTMFGLGLLLLAVAGIATAIGYSRLQLAPHPWSAWPLGIGVALLLPQFYLPPTGRVAFGVLYLGAALLLVRDVAGTREHRGTATPRPDPDHHVASWK